MVGSLSGATRDPASTGIESLDAVLSGGFTRDRLFLVEGTPGTGKTTLGLQFLRCGAEAGETVLHVALSETETELRAAAATHGWDLAGVHIKEFTPSEAALSPDEQNTLFHPSELELVETTRRILEEVERLKPQRLVLDSLSEPDPPRRLQGVPSACRRRP